MKESLFQNRNLRNKHFLEAISGKKKSSQNLYCKLSLQSNFLFQNYTYCNFDFNYCNSCYHVHDILSSLMWLFCPSRLYFIGRLYQLNFLRTVRNIVIIEYTAIRRTCGEILYQKGTPLENFNLAAESKLHIFFFIDFRKELRMKLFFKSDCEFLKTFKL